MRRTVAQDEEIFSLPNTIRFILSHARQRVSRRTQGRKIAGSGGKIGFQLALDWLCWKPRSLISFAELALICNFHFFSHAPYVRMRSHVHGIAAQTNAYGVHSVESQVAVSRSQIPSTRRRMAKASSQRSESS